MSDNSVRIEIRGLEGFLRALKKDAPVVRIGVLAANNKPHRPVSRNGVTLQKVSPTQAANLPSNAEIGAFHEFGTKDLPVRSFLRMPLTEKLGPKMEEVGAMDDDVLKDIAQTKSLNPYMQDIAILAEGIVQEAFETGGFGQWEPSNMKYKENHQTLVETQQLRDSITSEVID